ncbi:YceI family protein [Thalassotalea agariperforans]
MRILLTLVTCLLSLPSVAHWQLDNENSQLNFVSIKKEAIAEVHTFKALSGQINEQGKVTFAVDLASVETNIAIRNERMTQYLFETDKFAQATFSTEVDKKTLATLKLGESKKVALTGEINLHGVSQSVSTEVLVTKLSDGKVLVNSLQPVIINASTFGLTAGIEKLKSLASLTNISFAVPVTFQLSFIAQ